jgi:hypothetical protein
MDIPLSTVFAGASKCVVAPVMYVKESSGKFSKDSDGANCQTHPDSCPDKNYWLRWDTQFAGTYAGTTNGDKMVEHAREGIETAKSDCASAYPSAEFPSVTLPLSLPAKATSSSQNRQYQVKQFNAECDSGDDNLGDKNSVGDCAKACADTAGCEYFIYGKGSKAKSCYHETTTSASCPNNWQSDKFDFYQIDPAPFPAHVTKLQTGKECDSSDVNLGDHNSLAKCADKCKATRGCQYFIYGTGSKAGSCHYEQTTSASCPQGWQSDKFNFYRNDAYVAPTYQLLQTGKECDSGDSNLGSKSSVAQCAAACKARSGCKYFIYGTGSKNGKCYYEKTSRDNCPNGWQSDKYNFYKIA